MARSPVSKGKLKKQDGTDERQLLLLKTVGRQKSQMVALGTERRWSVVGFRRVADVG